MAETGPNQDVARFWLAAIVQSSNDAIVGKDLNGIVRTWNPSAEHMFGFAADEMIGQSILRIIPSDRTAEEAAILYRLRQGQRIEHFETVRQHKSGRLVPVSLTVSPIRDSGGTIIGVSKTARDLTEQRERDRRMQSLQDELAHVSRLTDLGQLVAALAHEVNQPLTAMINYLSGVRRLLSNGNLPAASTGIDRIGEQAERARAIVQRLRDQIRKQDMRRQKESLQATIEEASQLARVGVEHGLEVSVDVNEHAAFAMIDKVQIQQVLFNLLRNAAEAMDQAAAPDRSVTIRTAPAGNMVEISVADTGPGLSPEIRANLFKPFITTKPNGMGIGLSVCRSIVEAHGGELQVDTVPSGGAVFRLTVPVAIHAAS